jgi:uncharacterized membrane protein
VFKVSREKIIYFGICFLFFIAYFTLSVVRHNHFGSGYDLGIVDQAVWEYSNFNIPITTVQSYSFSSLLTDHVEIIYAILSPFYWIWSDARMLILLQSLLIALSGIPIFLLAKKRKVNINIAYSILISYLAFYGIQNAVWADVHSIVFGASFLSWLIYFLETKRNRLSVLAFLLAILSKENIAGLTAVIGIVYFIISRRKIGLYMTFASIGYLFLVFGVYFPHFTLDGYRYKSNMGLASNFNPYYMIDSKLKEQVFTYSFLWFGFLPILSPLILIPAIADLYSYFVLANHIKAGHELVQHYRVTLAVLMMWPTIIAISKYKLLNKKWMAVYLLFFACIVQYALHLPLSYLSKSWFWMEPKSVTNINKVINYLPSNVSVVSQNNITPHISHRNPIFTLFPTKKTFKNNSPCGTSVCDWFYWVGKPVYLIVDTSSDWDLRHFLTTRDEFTNGLNNMVKMNYLKLYKSSGDAKIYFIEK